MTIEPVRLSELARGRDLKLSGPDAEIVTFGALNTHSPSVDRMLTWIVDSGLIGELDRTGIGACVAHESVAAELGERPLLVTSGDPAEQFYSLYIELARSGTWKALESRRGENVQIATSAVVHEGVQLGDDCVIMDQVVVLPNTRIGDRVTVKPAAVIGGDGFQVITIDGTPTMVPHRGGVWIGDDVQIGSQTCVDRGMFGGLTVIEDGTRIDNLVHIGHSAQLGPGGIVAACTELGAITAGEGFWLGPNCAVLQEAHLGHHSYVGIGSVVIGDIAPHALAYGVPARPHAWVCSCRTKLEFSGRRASCRRCGREFALEDGSISELA